MLSKQYKLIVILTPPFCGGGRIYDNTASSIAVASVSWILRPPKNGGLRMTCEGEGRCFIVVILSFGILNELL